MKANTSYHHRADQLLITITSVCAAAAALLTVFMFVFLIREALPAVSSISAFRFFTDSGWFPSEGAYNIVPMIAGTLLVTLVATVLAAPLGLALALFHHFAAPAWAKALSRRTLEALAAIPSVIYGFWGLLVLVPLIERISGSGQSWLAAGIVIALMILPTITLFIDSSLASVSLELRLATVALGFSDVTTAARVYLPHIRRGILAALTIGVGRALGETMAVLMVAGNIPQIPVSLVDPIRTLTANIALEMAYATDTHRSALFASAVVLLSLSAVLATFAQRVRNA